MNKKLLSIVLGIFLCRWIAAEPAVTITAQSRLPWSSEVDLFCTISGFPAEKKMAITLRRWDEETETSTDLNEVKLNNIPVTNQVTLVENGSYHFVWNAEWNLSEETKLYTMFFDVILSEPLEEGTHPPYYCVIDLSDGPNASNYPVSYLYDVPEGGWTEEYKTSKIVLRRIPEGSIRIGSPYEELGHSSDERDQYLGFSTFWMGVFEVTQKQWELVMGTNPSTYVGDSRPVESVSYEDIRGSSTGAHWPKTPAVDSTSFLGVLRNRVQGLVLDLPTEARWEYACRARTTTALHNNKQLTNTLSCKNLAEVGRYGYNGGPENHHAVVGSYQPNQWGLYDMHGNIKEWCLDWYGEYLSLFRMNPKGNTSGETRVFRGGGWNSPAHMCRSAARDSAFPSDESNTLGFRLSADPTLQIEAEIFRTRTTHPTVVNTGYYLHNGTPVEIYWNSQHPLCPNATVSIWVDIECVAEHLVGEGCYTLEPPSDYGQPIPVSIFWMDEENDTCVESKEMTIQFHTQLTADMIGFIPDQIYTGEPIIPEVWVRDEYGYDCQWIYSASFSNNVNVGVASVVIDDEYYGSGSVTRTFLIKEPTPAYTATPLSPWNGLVDIAFDVSWYAEGQGKAITLKRVDPVTGEKTDLRYVWHEGNELIQGVTYISNGTHHFLWDAKTDLGSDVILEKLSFDITFSDPQTQYCVIDLSGGPTATAYPVSFLPDIPEGGWTEEYKTTKLVLRRIPAGTFWMGRGDISRSTADKNAVRFAHDFWMGIFEVTQKQWELVMGKNPAEYQGDSRPQERVSYEDIRGSKNGAYWPWTSTVDTKSFIGKLRNRIRGCEFLLDLPTVAQWEYACRAGTLTELNNGQNRTSLYNCTNLNTLGRYKGNASANTDEYSEHTTVGSYLANAWGLYDMHGNVSEWCLDASGSYDSSDSGLRIDPRGSTNTTYRHLCGGCWKDYAYYCESGRSNASTPSLRNNQTGFRLAATYPYPQYCIIDMVQFRHEPSRSNLRYIEEVPRTGWTDVYKTHMIPLRKIPAGTFMMGSPSNERDRNDDETLHQVTLTEDYWMAVFETTQRQWSFFASYSYINVSEYEGDTRPVDSAWMYPVRGDDQAPNWPDRSTISGSSFIGNLQQYLCMNDLWVDLPTEAQWEYACRAGTTGPTYFGDVGDRCVLFQNGFLADEGLAEYLGHAPVGDYWANTWGLYDMHGNVRELCLDWYGEYGSEAVIDPTGPETGDTHIQRGGGWHDYVANCRSAFRQAPYWWEEEDYCDDGFRIAAMSKKSAIDPQVCPSIAVDTREEISVISSSISIPWSSLWAGNSESKTTVSINGVPVVEEAPGEGVYLWENPLPGRYTLELSTHKNGSIQTTQTTVILVQRELTPEMIFPIADQVYTGSAIEPSILIVDGNPSGLSLDDYRVQFANNVTVGTASVTITGTRNYSGTLTTSFSIVPRELTQDMIAELPDCMVTGEPIVPGIILIEESLTENDYQVSYANNQAVGVATVTIQGRGNFTGQILKTFSIHSFSSGADSGPEFSWTTGGNAPWFTQTRVTSDGVDALQSGAIGDREESWIVAEVSGPGVLEYQWKVSSEDRFDSLFMDVDGETIGRISGEQGWEEKTVTVSGAGIHTLRWRYVKGRSASAGQDCAWLDHVRWRPLSLADALDTPEGIVWTSSGDAEWIPQTEITSDDEDAVQSGPLQHYGIARLETHVIGPQRISFQWKVSSEEMYDCFDFLVDERVEATITGETGWRKVLFDVPEGAHTLAWEYWKDSEDEEGLTGQDCAWLDDVVLEARIEDSPPTLSTETTPVPVPITWLEESLDLPPGTTASDYETHALGDADGDGMATWEEYVAGSDPSDESSVFRASIDIQNGTPHITWTPDLGESRHYRVEGKTSLDSTTPWEPADTQKHHFFRVKVKLLDESNKNP